MAADVKGFNSSSSIELMADEQRPRYRTVRSGYLARVGLVYMGQVTKLWLSCYLVLLTIDSKTR